jgi:hypothetical protein
MANYMSIKGTTQTSFQIGAGNGKQPFTLDASGLSSPRTWVIPDSNGSLGDVLTTDGAGTLSWAAPGAVTISGVIIGDTDCGLLSEIVTANVDFGLASNVPYSTMNLGAA